MEPNIRVKRYASRSKHLRRAPRRRGSTATAILVALILIVAALAVWVALSPSAKHTETKSPVAKQAVPATQPSPAPVAEATQTPRAAAETSAPAEPATTGRRPTSVAAVSADPNVITPSALPNSTGDVGLAPTTSIKVEMSAPATVSVRILDQQGATVARLFTGRLDSGTQTYDWDGKYAAGDAVAAGDYFVRVQVLGSNDPGERGAWLEGKLQAFPFIMRGPRSRRAVALTIDDGWNADMRIVSYLKANKVPATAFLIGGRGVVDQHPEFVRTLMKSGFEIANHTYDHEWLTDITPAAMRQDIKKAQDLITKITGYNHHWVRASGGSISTTVLRAGRKNGYNFVQWTVDSGDTRDGSTPDRVAQTLNSVDNGSIILTHFGGKGTYDYIRQIVPALRKRGFAFKTLSDLMAGVPIDQGTDIPPVKPIMRTLSPPPFGAVANML